MPYGIAKTLGGDNPANDAKMEAQVKALMDAGHDQISAIKIAKASMQKSAKKYGSLREYLDGK